MTPLLLWVIPLLEPRVPGAHCTARGFFLPHPDNRALPQAWPSRPGTAPTQANSRPCPVSGAGL